jgi:hypothetical protein
VWLPPWLSWDPVGIFLAELADLQASNSRILRDLAASRGDVVRVEGLHRPIGLLLPFLVSQGSKVTASSAFSMSAVCPGFHLLFFLLSFFPF